MRKLLLLASALLPLSVHAQLATFDTLNLSGPDTFYVNYSLPGEDAGFDDGSIHFPCVYDTSFGGLWSTGFAYSNMTDSSTSGYENMYSAKAAKGYNGSDKYAVYQAGYGAPLALRLAGGGRFAPTGFYLTNSTYTYNSMRDGYFVAKKFGGVSGNDSDWFKLTIYAYDGGRKADSLHYYLADFRFAGNALDYIVKDWRYVDLTSLGPVDSLGFALSSSDTGAFGMNTPGYFCMDHFSVSIPAAGVSATHVAVAARAYPNPATDKLHVEINDASLKLASIFDMSGRLIAQQPIAGARLMFNTGNFADGIYILKLEGANGVASMRFVKQ